MYMYNCISYHLQNGLTALEVATASGSFTAEVCALLAEAMPHHLPVCICAYCDVSQVSESR